jgi:transcriptional regulator with PAS, ATPase and Fis domain
MGENILATHPLPSSGQVVIGRGDSADIPIQDASISRSHARIRIGSELLIEDLGSANGTRIGERKLRPMEPVPLVLGQAVDLGSVMIMAQSSRVMGRPRRLWSHDQFEARLEDECLRGERGNGRFALVRIHLSGATQSEVILDLLSRASEPRDMVASYGPHEYEVLLAERSIEQAVQAQKRITMELANSAVEAHTGLACYPQDGRTPESLIGAASVALRGQTDVESHPSCYVADPAMQRLHRIVDRIAKGNISVLLLGETGVGKEVMAEAIHRASARAEKAFVRINCAAVTETLLESELFGYEKGAFTGATQSKPGLFETAHDGTIFLDEVGELPLTMQSKLLRVLEDRQVMRVGSLKGRPVDVRFVSATNRNLEEEVARGRFRQDLFFRLSGIPIVVPPLRQRVCEIEGLARRFLIQICAQLGREPVLTLAEGSLDLLLRYSWPGNIRELRNVIERAVLLCTGNMIEREHLPVEKMTSTLSTPSVLPFTQGEAAPPLTRESTEQALREALDAKERQRIIDALSQFGGNQSHAAQFLNISRSTLIARMQKYNLPRPRPKRK